MHRAEIAEAVLSLAAPREIAVSIVGDFLEDDLSSFQFWVLVGRTAVAQTWRQLAAHPKAIARTLIRTLVAESGYLLGACFVYFFLLYIAECMVRAFFQTDVADWGEAGLQWSILNLLVPFWMGRWMARRYDERAAAAIMAIAALHTMLNLCAVLCLRSGADAHIDIIIGLPLIYWDAAEYRNVLHSAILYATLYPVVVLAGATSFRAGIPNRQLA
jgi:hypothetical protein